MQSGGGNKKSQSRRPCRYRDWRNGGNALSGTIKYPLYGVKIGVTGTKSITKKLRNRLEELGATVTELDYATLVPDWENEP